MTAINITNPGSGYTSAPTIALGGPGTGATATGGTPIAIPARARGVIDTGTDVSAVNTAVLLTSSLCVALAVRSLKLGRRRVSG